MDNSKMGVDVVQCRKCVRRAEGVLLTDLFDLGGILPLYHYDQERGVLQINEDLLLYAVRLVNPMLQRAVPLELARRTDRGDWVPARRDADGRP